MTLDAYLTSQSDRCSGCGYHLATQGCRCTGGEWTVFVAAVRAAARPDGTVHQADVRPLIRGRIEPKHIGTAYRRAVTDGLLRRIRHEESDDTKGKNAGRMEPVYRLAS